MRKTTKAEFRRFQESFKEWQALLGCPEYEVEMELADIPGSYAELDTNPEGCHASLKFCIKHDGDPEPEATGLHEALHLRLARLVSMAKRRWVSEEDIDREEEGVVRVLEKLLRED